MPFLNRVRLPLTISKPQFPDESNIFQLADGSRKVQSIVISKTYEGSTDYLPEWVHQRLKIAICHDILNIEGDRYVGGAVKEGEYEIEWSDFKDYPYAQAKFKIAVTPFNATNSNCQSCDELTQLELEDDYLEETLEQSSNYEINVFENDHIGCSPIVATIVNTHAVFVDSATISPTGTVTINTKPLFFQRNTVKLLTYRVTCPNGSYDEADVYANMDGEEEACLEPTNLSASGIEYNEATVSWTAPSPVPGDGYEWKVAQSASPAVNVDSGTTASTSVTVEDLDPATSYIFSVRSKCDTDDYSEWVNRTFTTSALGTICGKYSIGVIGTTGHPFERKDVTMIDCSGHMVTMVIVPFQNRIVCLTQNSPGNPVYLIGADNITYLGPCE